MTSNPYSTVGRLLLAVAILALGLIHIITQNFPTGLLPVPAGLPGREILVYVSGAAMIISGLLLVTKKKRYPGAVLAAIIWLIYLLGIYLPKLIMTYDSPDYWTGTFEVVMFLAGSIILTGIGDPAKNNKFNLILIATYLYASALVVFFVLHFKYTQFIVMLIPAWLPFRFFWANVVTVAFLLSGLSLIIRWFIKLSMLLLALMFFIWFVILHLPRVIGDMRSEPEWSSTFVALAAGGVALLIAGAQKIRDELK